MSRLLLECGIPGLGKGMDSDWIEGMADTYNGKLVRDQGTWNLVGVTSWRP